MVDPQQELYGRLLVLLRQEFGKDIVFDGYLPPDGTPYPFVYLSGTHQVDDMGNKMQTLGMIYQTIDVWMDDPHKRGTLSQTMNKCIDIARNMKHTKTYAWQMTGCDKQVVTDTSTSTPLMHGIINIDFRLLGGTEV